MRTACYFRRERITPHSNGSVTMKRIIAAILITLGLAAAGAGAAAAAHASTPDTLYRGDSAPYTLYRG